MRIETPKIAGSLSLTGARLDDVSLKAYRETVDPNSPIIVLLSPLGGPNGYYSDFGWVAAPGANVSLPNATTVWTADAQVLTPAKPLTLTWDNGQGLLFRGVVTVDDNAMFQIRDEVENKGAAPVSLFPYAQVVRHGRPATLGYYVLHEGLIGYVGDHGLQEFTYDHVDKEPLLSPGTNAASGRTLSAASSASPTNTGPRLSCPTSRANMTAASPRFRPAARAPIRPISCRRR